MASVGDVGLAKQVWNGIKQLNPETVRQDAERRFQLGIAGNSSEMDAMIAWLTAGKGVGQAGGMIHRIDTSSPGSVDNAVKNYDLIICASNCSAQALGVPLYKLHVWNPSKPEDAVRSILNEDKLRNIHLALAHWFPSFRKEMNYRIIRSTSVENAAFVASTAIGNIIPNPLAPLSALAEAAGDVVVLTGNQVRMLFRLAGANSKPVGFKELLPQMGSIIAAAFGWRALARELVSKIPLGGGLVAKSAVAYAGTWTVGEGIAVYFSTGRKMTKRESNERFEKVMGEARQVAVQLTDGFKQRVKVLSPGRQG